MKPTILLTILTAAALGGCAAKATLTGTVTHERTLGLVTDARVLLGPASDTRPVATNYAGRFSTELKAGTYPLRVEHPRLKPCAGNPETVTLVEGELRELSLCMADE